MKLFEKKKPVSAAAASGEEKKDDAAVPVSVQLRRKAVIMGISLVLLLVFAAVGTVGWYTRLNNVSGITLDIAKFDFRANFSDDTFMVDVNDYREVHTKKAAPGTSGVIPVYLSSNSEIAADYYLYMDLTQVAPEMLQRIRFYVYRAQTDDQGYYVDYSGKRVTEWKDAVPVLGSDGKPQKFYLGGIRPIYASDTNNNSRTLNKDSVYASGPVTGNFVAYDLATCAAVPTIYTGGRYLNYFSVTGQLNSSVSSCYEYVYWEWIYEIDTDPYSTSCSIYDVQTGRWESWTEYNSRRGYGGNLNTLASNHDAYDTRIGNGEFDNLFSSAIDPINFGNVKSVDGKLLAYQAALMPKICADGVQATPMGRVGSAGNTYSPEVLTAGGGLTVYVDEDAVYGRK